MKTMTTVLAALLAAAAARTAPAENLLKASDRTVDLATTPESAGKMNMKFILCQVPKGTAALKFTGEVRYAGVARGDQSWFDARIMSQYCDTFGKKQADGPLLGNWTGDADWKPFSHWFNVKGDSPCIALMPCLFNVKSGELHLRNLSLAPAARRPEEDPAAARRAQARARLDREGSLIPPQKDGALYADLKCVQPGKMEMAYREYDVPAGVDALKLAWTWKVANLKTGDKPWFDARMLLKFKDAGGKELAQSPGPVYVQHDTAGWKAEETSFLVPSNAVTLAVMPCLFQVKAGEMQMKDVTLAAADAAPLRAAARARARQEAARRVPDEKEDRAKWPKPLKVAGNRLVDPDGREVWLQGVNAGGLETLPFDDQMVKSAVVAVDAWRANCIRLPVNEAHWFGTSAYQDDGGASFRARVDKIVRLAANRGAYVAIDLHRFRAPKKEHVAFWKDVAAHYKNHPAVLFDLFNEPHDISWEVWRNGGWVGEAGKADESAFLSDDEKKKNRGFESVGMQALVDAARSTGARNVVLASGLFWANDLTGIESEAIEKGEKPSYRLSDPDGNGIVYEWHTYHWHKGWARVLPVAAKHPVFLGEVGACPLGIMNFIPDKDQEDPYTFVPDMLGFIQKHRINWTGWCFHPKAAPVMIQSWDYDPTPYWGAFAKRALAGEKFEMKRMR